MLRLFKTLLLYPLMLAIPAQGFTASTMLFCGPSHQRLATAQEADRHAAHGHANILAADRHGPVLPQVSVDSADHASDDDVADLMTSDSGPGNAGEPGKFKCSACAACCVGAAIPVSGMKFQIADQSIERIAATSFLNIGFVTDAPRRPPRPLLA